MALSDGDRQTLIVATKQHRKRLGINPTTGKAAANSITRRTALATVFAGIVGMRGSK